MELMEWLQKNVNFLFNNFVLKCEVKLDFEITDFISLTVLNAKKHLSIFDGRYTGKLVGLFYSNLFDTLVMRCSE